MPPKFNKFKKQEDTPASSENQPQKANEQAYGGFWDDKEEKSPSANNAPVASHNKGKPNFLKKEQPAVQEIQPQSKETNQQSQNQDIKVPVQQQSQKQASSEIPKSNFTKINDIPLSKSYKPVNEFELIQGEDLSNPLIQFEGKSVEDVIAPGGIRLKQNQVLLDEFVESCTNFQTPVIGSFLIAKLYQDLPLQQKVRAVYAIQELIRKLLKFQNYFRHHLSSIVSSPNPQNDLNNQFQQELSLVSALITNPSATSSENTDVKFEYKTTFSNPVIQNTKVNTTNGGNIQTNIFDDNPFEIQEQNQVPPKKKGFDFVKKNKPANQADFQPAPQQNISPLIQEESLLPQETQKKASAFKFLKKKHPPPENSQANYPFDEKLTPSVQNTNLLIIEEQKPPQNNNSLNQQNQYHAPSSIQQTNTLTSQFQNLQVSPNQNIYVQSQQQQSQYPPQMIPSYYPQPYAYPPPIYPQHQGYPPFSGYHQYPSYPPFSYPLPQQYPPQNSQTFGQPSRQVQQSPIKQDNQQQKKSDPREGAFDFISF